MKKQFIRISLILSAVVVLFSSCTPEVKCSTPQDDNYNSQTNACDENATCAKFVRTNVTMQINGNTGSTYIISIVMNTVDYKIDVNTDWGITSAGVQSFTYSVAQSTATLDNAPVSFAGGSIDSSTINLNTSTNKVTINITFSGLGVGFDGTTADTEA